MVCQDIILKNIILCDILFLGGDLLKNHIDELLEQQGKTRYWLAKEINVSYAAVCKLANNQTESIKFEVIRSICKALGCSLNDLFTLED